MTARAKKSGIGADIEKKLDAKYDQEEADGTVCAIVTWVNAVLKEHDPNYVAIPGSDFDSIFHAFKDGTKLCQLINVLLASKGLAAHKFKQKNVQMFQAQGNIDTYNKACEEYGMKVENKVQSADVWEGSSRGCYLNLINSLHSLGMLANAQGFGITYMGTQQKCMNRD